MARMRTHRSPAPADPRPDPLALAAWDASPAGPEAAAARASFASAWDAFRRGDLATARRLARPLATEAPDPGVRTRAADLIDRLRLDRPTLGAWAVACLLFLWIWVGFT